jgi:hypothetical protein
MHQDRRHPAAFFQIADIAAIDLDEAIVGSHGDIHVWVPFKAKSGDQSGSGDSHA